MSEIPDSYEDVVDLAGKARLLKAKNSKGSIELRDSETIEVQPSGTPLGMRLRAKDNGELIPTVLFSTDKMRDPKKAVNAEDVVDSALADWEEQQ